MAKILYLNFYQRKYILCNFGCHNFLHKMFVSTNEVFLSWLFLVLGVLLKLFGALARAGVVLTVLCRPLFHGSDSNTTQP